MFFGIKAISQHEGHSEGLHTPYGVRVHQEKRFFQKVSMGATWGILEEKIFGAREVEKMKLNWHISFAAGFESPYGSHQLTYNLGHSSVGLFNRFFLDEKHQWGLTVLFENHLSQKKENYNLFSFGVEKAFEVKTLIPKFEMEVVPFVEFGTLLTQREENFFSFGILLKTNCAPFHRGHYE